MSDPQRWAVQWRSKGDNHIMWDKGMPLLFHTRREARAEIRERWGYIATRRDLLRHPHNWRMPRAIRVNVMLRESVR